MLSNNYYPTFKRDNVSLHTDEIVSVNGKTIETKDGSFRELDVLVLATGFDYTLNFPPGYWIGRGGIDIPTAWHDNPTTYYGTFIPDAPNFYMLCGPTTIIGKFDNQGTHLTMLSFNYRHTDTLASSSPCCCYAHN